jgi:hypothetical protein
MVTTARAIRDDLSNILDYLIEAGLALSITEIASDSQRVSWHAHDRLALFISSRGHPTIDQYVSWLRAGHYSALLFDGSLVQFTYQFEGGNVVAHRLCYAPCPFVLDLSLFQTEDPLEVIALYADANDNEHLALRSPIRFDFDIRSAKPGHPASHVTVNSDDCRIACVAPIHPYRFVDFVFRNFHPLHRQAHRTFFDDSASRHIGEKTIADGERNHIHVAWSLDSLAG